MTFAKITVTGTKELQAGVGKMDAAAQEGFRVAYATAADTVARDAARRVPRKTGAAAASLRVDAAQREAVVTGGSRRVPYFGWLEWGGKRTGRGGGVATRPWVKQGRYLGPALEAHNEALEKALIAALADAARQAGFEVKS